MNLKQKTLFYGLLIYSFGWLLLIINGMNFLETFGYGLCFAGVFSLACSISLRINDASYTEGETK